MTIKSILLMPVIWQSMFMAENGMIAINFPHNQIVMLGDMILIIISYIIMRSVQTLAARKNKAPSGILHEFKFHLPVWYEKNVPEKFFAFFSIWQIMALSIFLDNITRGTKVLTDYDHYIIVAFTGWLILSLFSQAIGRIFYAIKK